MSVAGSALRGAGRIIAIGRRPITLELAKEYGATDVLNYMDGPIDEQVLELTGGVAPDCCITTGGTNDTFARCLKMVKPNGIVSNLQAQTFDTEIPGMYTSTGSLISRSTAACAPAAANVCSVCCRSWKPVASIRPSSSRTASTAWSTSWTPTT